MDDAASRFWGKYILKTTPYNVPERARRWLVRHAEVFIKAQSGRRLTTLTADDMERYLKEKAEVKNWLTGNSGKWLMPCISCAKRTLNRRWLDLQTRTRYRNEIFERCRNRAPGGCGLYWPSAWR